MAWLVVSVMGMGAMNGCELANTVIPRADPQLVVYAILDPSAQFQVVLVEHSLTGQFDTTVAKDGAVKGAVVKLTDPDGKVMMGTEQVSGGKSLGEYIIFGLLGTNLQRGKRYTLSVNIHRRLKRRGVRLEPTALVLGECEISRKCLDRRSISCEPIVAGWSRKAGDWSRCVGGSRDHSHGGPQS